MSPAEIQNKPRKQAWYKRRRSTVTGPAPGPAAPKTPKRPLADAAPASGEPSFKIRRLAGSTGKTPTRLGPRTPTFATVKAEDEEPWYTVRRSRHDALANDPAAGTSVGGADRMTPPLTTRPADSPLANAGPSVPTPIPSVPTPGLSIHTPIPTGNTPGRVGTRNQRSVAAPSHTPFDVYDFNDVDADEVSVPLRRASGNSRSRPASAKASSARASASRASVPSAAAKPATTTTTATTTATATATAAADAPPYMSLRSRGENTQSGDSNSGLRYPPRNIKRLPFTQKRPVNLVLPGGGSTARWNQTKLKAALSTTLGMSAATFTKLLENLEEYFERPAAPQNGWIWIPCPGSGTVAVDVRKLGYAEFGEELVEAVLGKDAERRALVEDGKVPLVGYLFYHTLLAAGTRRAARQRSIAAKKTQLSLVSLVLLSLGATGKWLTGI